MLPFSANHFFLIPEHGMFFSFFFFLFYSLPLRVLVVRRSFRYRPMIYQQQLVVSQEYYCDGNCTLIGSRT